VIASGRTETTLAGLLRHPRYEVLPLDGVEDVIVAHVPAEGTRVTVTASPRKGLEATLALAERLAGHGYTVVAHLSARLVRDSAHLHDVLERLLAAGVVELFVPAGDAETPAGEFHSAADVLAAMGELRPRFAEVGITGYPESHHLIDDDTTISAMFAKAPMATCIVSQLCFDGATTADWIARVRARGTTLPIWIGVPGVVDYAKLVRISMKIGLGESTRFLRHHQSWMRRLVTRSFRPDRLIRELEPAYSDPSSLVAGFHVYTFNEVERTERWRREMLERLAAPNSSMASASQAARWPANDGRT
jgi:methylenetetrahydrofolate reductase (NADPH)